MVVPLVAWSLALLSALSPSAPADPVVRIAQNEKFLMFDV